MLNAALESLLGEGGAHGARVLAVALTREGLLSHAPHAEEIEVEERQGLAAHGVVNGPLAEHPHLEAPARGLVVEVDECGAGGGPGRGALADLHDAVRHVGRKVPLEDLHEDDALPGRGGVRHEARVKARRGGDVAPAELADRLADVGLGARHRADVLLGIRHANDEPAAARVGKRGHDLGDLAAHARREGLLELQGKALLVVRELREVGVLHVRKRLGRALPIAKRAEHGASKERASLRAGPVKSSVARSCRERRRAGRGWWRAAGDGF